MKHERTNTMNAIKTITPKTLVRRHKAKELYGLVMAGCVNNLEETIDFVNKELRSEGIFRTENEYKYEDCLVFEHDGQTCLVFPFLRHIPLDTHKMAFWRLQIRQFVCAMWVEDYIFNCINN